MRDWTQPVEVSDADVAFGGAGVGIDALLPKRDELPEDYSMNSNRPSVELVSQWFFSGLTNPQFHPREGVDANAAFRQIKACMGSFEPKHERKTEGVAFLLDTFFEKVEADEGTWELEKLDPTDYCCSCMKKLDGDRRCTDEKCKDGPPWETRCPYCGSNKPRVSGDEAHEGYTGYPYCPDCKGV